MKTLLILRHAKAQPDHPDGDRARELTDQGRQDATTIGDHLQALVGRPDAIVTSDARRAQQTAELVATAAGFDAPLTLEPAVYDADPATLLALVQRLPDEAGCVLLVGHNPGLEELVAALAITDDAIDLPTAGLAHLEFDVAQWGEVREGGGRWLGLSTPGALA